MTKGSILTFLAQIQFIFQVNMNSIVLSIGKCNASGKYKFEKLKKPGRLCPLK